MAVEPPGEVPVDGLAATVGLHADHLDDLASPTHEFGEVAPLWFRQWSCLGSHALREERDHLGVERIGLSEAAHGLGEVTDLTRVDDAERQPDACKGRRDGGFEAARCLEDNESDGSILEAASEAVQALGVARDAEGLTR